MKKLLALISVLGMLSQSAVALPVYHYAQSSNSIKSGTNDLIARGGRGGGGGGARAGRSGSGRSFSGSRSGSFGGSQGGFKGRPTGGAAPQFGSQGGGFQGKYQGGNISPQTRQQLQNYQGGNISPQTRQQFRNYQGVPSGGASPQTRQQNRQTQSQTRQQSRQSATQSRQQNRQNFYSNSPYYNQGSVDPYWNNYAAGIAAGSLTGLLLSTPAYLGSDVSSLSQYESTYPPTTGNTYNIYANEPLPAAAQSNIRILPCSVAQQLGIQNCNDAVVGIIGRDAVIFNPTSKNVYAYIPNAISQ